MSAPPEATLPMLRELSRAAGFDWSDAELETIRPVAARFLAMLASLETVPAEDVEAAIQYRIL